MRERVDALIQVSARQWLAFADPIRTIWARTPGEVSPVLSDVQQLVHAQGCYAVGYVTYEAGAAFGLPVRDGAPGPLAAFALFDASHVRALDASPGRVPQVPDHSTPQPVDVPSYTLGPVTPTLDRPAFRDAFERIKGHIAAGDTYQVNFTFPLVGRFAGDPWALFADLVAAQRGHYSAFVRMGALCICSASPESFFTLTNGALAARPMKGTMRRGRTLAEDREAARALRASAKDQAEHVMIVDMMRNDLGRIARRHRHLRQPPLRGL